MPTSDDDDASSNTPSNANINIETVESPAYSEEHFPFPGTTVWDHPVTSDVDFSMQSRSRSSSSPMCRPVSEIQQTDEDAKSVSACSGVYLIKSSRKKRRFPTRLHKAQIPVVPIHLGPPRITREWSVHIVDFSKSAPEKVLTKIRPKLPESENQQEFLKPYRTRIATFVKELKSLCRLAGMTSLTTLFSLVIFSTNTAFLGRLGTDELAGSALAQLSTLFLFGMASAINTLASQAYGAKNYKLVGIWLQVSIVGTTFLCVPVIIIFWFSGSLVALVEDNDDVVHFATIFAKWSCLTIWPTGMFAAICQYFQVQNIVLPSVVVNFVAIFVNFGLNQLLIHGAFGWRGMGICLHLSSISAMSTAILCCRTTTTSIFGFLLQRDDFMGIRKMHRPTWPGWNLNEITGTRVWAFLKMSLPTGLALVFDESVFQALVLMASRTSDVGVASLGIVFNVFSFVWGLWWGIGLATQVRVGTNLGGGQAFQAKISFICGSILTLILNIFVFVVCLGFPRDLARPFTTDDKVLDAVADLSEVMALCFVAYCFSGSVLSTLEGMGRIFVMAGFQLAFAYGISLPLAYVLCFHYGFGSEGLLLGSGIGDTLKFISSFLYFTLATNWDREVSIALERSECMDDSDDDAESTSSSDDQENDSGVNIPKQTVPSHSDGSTHSNPLETVNELTPLIN
eukprot:gene6883-9536_t